MFKIQKIKFSDRNITYRDLQIIKKVEIEKKLLTFLIVSTFLITIIYNV